MVNGEFVAVLLHVVTDVDIAGAIGSHYKGITGERIIWIAKVKNAVGVAWVVACGYRVGATVKGT